MSTLEILAYLAPVVAIVAFLLTPWGIPVLSALTGTKAGRYLSAIAAFVVWSSTYRAGKRAGAAGAVREVERANVQAVERHQATESRVARRSDDSLRDELRRYTPVILAVVFLGLGGCATVPTGGPGKGGAWCDIERPIALTDVAIDAMGSAELKAAVTHNRHGEAECGWKPPGKSTS